MKVLKFGGTSMANANSIQKVADIIRSDELNRFVIVSAPGKRETSDTKVTDLLYACYDEKQNKGVCDNTFLAVEKRFYDIITDLGIQLNLRSHFDQIRNDINGGASKDYTASRGEYLSAIVTAAYLGVEFIDATELIQFNMSGNFEPELTNSTAEQRLKNCKGAVIPGFYGVMPNGKIRTFSRGGSDITGSIIARAVGAKVYENWTDVDGFRMCDPRIVQDARRIPMLTYKELRELSYMGANVLHSDSIFPVRKHDIPIHIRNTFCPESEGTLIAPTKKFLSREINRSDCTVTGIAGKKDFVAIYIEKSMMNNEIGFVRKILSILENYNVSLEHIPSGVDTLTLVIDGSGISENTLNFIVRDIREACRPDNIEMVTTLALIAVVGHGMSRKKGTASRLCEALSQADINIRMIDQGSSELSIIVAVECHDYERAIAALYSEFGCE